MKCLSLFLITLIMFCNLSKIQLKLTPSELENYLGKGKNKKESIPEGILWQGWVKYITYGGDEIHHPNKFFENYKYFDQKGELKKLNEKDEKGVNVLIPSKLHFFAYLFKDHLNFVNSRKNAFATNYDSLDIDSIVPLGEDIWKSSIQNLGDFEEGSCIQIFTSGKKDSNKKSWVICLDNGNERDELWNSLVSLKKQFQGEPVEEEKSAEIIKGVESSEEKPKDWKPIDGYWVLLQDWTNCSLKCGGGKSVQHWMCVPPKEGGKPCEGEAIRVKPCNTKPCPGTKIINIESESHEEVPELNETNKPIIKVMSISNRPQVNMRCVRKESDIFYLVNENSDRTVQDNPTKRPARIILNNRTISLFLGQDYQNSIFSLDLQNTDYVLDPKDSCCFHLTNDKRNYSICGGFGSPCDNFVEEWQNDFNLFKYKCYIPQKEVEVSEEKVPQKGLDKMMNSINLDLVEERENLIEKKLASNDSNKMKTQLQTTEKVALHAVKKEMMIEKMLEKEMIMKLNSETKALEEQKKKEIVKQESINKIIKEREEENNKLLEGKHAEKEMAKIKIDTAKDIEQKRNELRERLARIQKKAERKKKLIQQEIKIIRGQMAKNLIDMNKKGDIQTCKLAYGNDKKMSDYCDENVVDNFEKNKECKENAGFCYICCENEFGAMFMLQRNECYVMCDDLSGEVLEKDGVKGSDKNTFLP